MLRRAAGLALALACAVALWTAAPASANHRWGRYHWARATLNTTVALGFNQPSSGWNFSNVLSDWTSASPDTPNGAPVISAGKGTKIPVQVGNYGANGWVGLAQIGIGSHNHIVSGLIQLNTYYLLTSGQQKSTYCMEVGHIFGLDHNNPGKRGGTPDDTCMNDYAWYEAPNVHDTQELGIIYDHADGVSTFSATRRQQPNSYLTIHETPASLFW